MGRSSAEVERSMAHGICEMIWLKKMMEELKIVFVLSMKLYCDNKVAISIALNSVQHDRIKHDEVDRHFIKRKMKKEMCECLLSRIRKLQIFSQKACLNQSRKFL